MTVPLVARDVIFGYAELWESRRHREFTADEISLCHSMAQQAAIAFENARLFEAERKQLRLAQTLQAVGALLTAGMSLNEVFDYIFDLLARVVRYDSVSIQLLVKIRFSLRPGAVFQTSGALMKSSAIARCPRLRNAGGSRISASWSFPIRSTIRAGMLCRAVSRSDRGLARRCA